MSAHLNIEAFLQISQQSEASFLTRTLPHGSVRAGRAIAIGIFFSSLVLPNARAHQESAPAGQKLQREIRSLEPGHVVEGKLADRAVHMYELNLLGGEFLRFTVAAQNPNTNIELTMVNPSGRKVEELSGPACPVALFSMYFLPVVSGVYHLRLELPRSDSSPTNYKLQIDELREATDLDQLRTSASQALVKAYRLSYQDPLAFNQEAAQKFEEAMALFRSALDRRGEAEVFQTLSFLSFAARDYQGAVDYMRPAQTLWHALADNGMEVAALESMANTLGRLGKSQEKADSLNQALPLRRALGDRSGEARDLDWLGDAYNAMGEYQKALTSYERALSIDSEQGVQYDLGHVYEELDEPQKALDYYRQGLNLARSHGDRGQEMDTLSLMANAYGEAGDQAMALGYYKRSLALAKGNRGDEADELRKLGNFYVAQGEYERALECFDQILPYFHAQHLAQLEASTLYSVGITYDRQGKWPQALEALNQSLSLWPFKDRTRRNILEEFGSSYLDSGDDPKALEIYGESLAESRATKDAQLEAVALCDIARAERALERTTEARRDVEAGLNILESERGRIAGTESRSSYFATVEKNYEFYIDLLMQMHAQHPEQGLAAAALQASERARARSLLDMLVEAHADIHEGADPRLLERERNLRQRFRARSEYQLELLSGSHTPQQAEEVARELQSLASESDETEAQIRAISPRYAALTQPQPLNLKQIQEELLDNDTLLLEYALGKDRSYLWAVTPTSLVSFTLPNRTEIEEESRRFRELLTARSTRVKNETEEARSARIARVRTEFPAAASRLSEMVLGPVAPLLGNKRLVLVNDGVLQYVPFAVLPIPRHGGPSAPLMTEHEIVTVPSASAVSVLRHEQSNRQAAPKLIAVLADPVFDNEDPRVTKRGRSDVAKPPSNAISDQLRRSWADLGVAAEGGQIPRLVFSRREAEAIMASAPHNESLEAVDFRASRATATSPALAHYRIVHFSTHGVLDSKNPALSGIILSLVDPQGRPQDGFLRLFDLYNLHLSADLVVLSACQTALGKEIRGEGFVGLTRGFLYAGAERIMASLWEVDDVATAELMSRFYRGILKEGLRPSAALQSAEKEMWQQKRWQDPYYWGGFTLEGEWR